MCKKPKYSLKKYSQLKYYILGFAAHACGIKRRGHQGFRHLPLQLKKIKETDITLHYKDLKGKMELYKSGRLKFSI